MVHLVTDSDSWSETVESMWDEFEFCIEYFEIRWMETRELQLSKCDDMETAVAFSGRNKP